MPEMYTYPASLRFDDGRQTTGSTSEPGQGKLECRPNAVGDAALKRS